VVCHSPCYPNPALRPRPLYAVDPAGPMAAGDTVVVIQGTAVVQREWTDLAAEALALYPAVAAGAAYVGNALFVDRVYGSDVLGTRGRFDRPYSTCGGARADAQSGDVVVVYPGAYAEVLAMKGGVNWFFYPGVTVGNDSGALTCAAGVTAEVRGRGTFAAGTGGFAVDVAGGTLTLECVAVTAESGAAVSAAGGTLTLRAERVAGGAAEAITVGAGAVAVHGARLEGAPGEAAVVLNGDGLTLSGCVLVAGAGAAVGIDAAAPHTLKGYVPSVTNVLPHANVTVLGFPIFRDPNVT
jgi:hypothetical protein